MQLDLNLSLLPGSRAKTDAWLFSAMLFPFCLAAGQEKQGLECKPFRGRLRPPLISLRCWCEAGRCCLPWGGGPRPYLVHWWQAAGLYLEQSVSWEDQGKATGSRDTLGHFSSSSVWHRRAQGQHSRGWGVLFP